MLKAVRCSLLALFLLAARLAVANGEPASALIHGNDAVKGLERQLVTLYQKYKDAVVKVKIAIQTLDNAGTEQVSLTVLSGFFIDAEGTVLTNAIPSTDGARIRVEKEGIQYLAIAIASDEVSNLGLLRLAKPPADLSFIQLDQSSHTLPIGSLAYGITSPLNFGATPKLGQVTGRESSFREIDFPFTYTRVSLSSGPAEGGSPVFDSDGSLIGVSVASLPDINSSYLVPTQALQRILASLRSGKPHAYPVVQAEFEARGNPATQEKYVTVERVASGSGAEKTGLKRGDIVLAFNERDIDTLNQLRDAIFYSEIGSFVTLLVRRNDEELEIPLLVEGNARNP